MRNEIDPISLGIFWDRLISIADEVLAALVRTSFSIIVREAYDVSVVLFDSKGASLAQGTFSAPSFTGTAPATIGHMLRRFSRDMLQSGDILITNDPWLGTGHLFDVSVMRPVFRGSRLVGYTMSISHLPDIGGRGFSTSAAEVYEEGLRLPICKLVNAGKLNQELLEFIRANVRVKEMVIGDLMAHITCNELAGRLLIEFMDEYGIDDLIPLSEAIIGQSEKAMREKIKEIPDGVYENKLQVEGIEEPITLACRLKITGDNIYIDFDGTSSAVRSGINVPICYTRAFAVYAIKCVTTPTIPNNEGSVAPIIVSAPEGCILNAQSPYPTGGRHAVGHFVTPLVSGALAKVIPKLVQADSGMFTIMNFQGTHRDGSGVSTVYYLCGGFGAINGLDGASATPGPSNMTGVPIEVWENLTSLTIEKKVLVPDTGGAGKYRGGLGEEIVLRNDSEHLMTASCFGQRTEFPAQGVNGGKPGKLRKYWINGKEVHPKGRYVLKPGDEMRMVEAGGGGYGKPSERPVEKVLQDVNNGFVLVKGALHDYGIKVNPLSLTAQKR